MRGLVWMSKGCDEKREVGDYDKGDIGGERGTRHAETDGGKVARRQEDKAGV